MIMMTVTCIQLVTSYYLPYTDSYAGGTAAAVDAEKEKRENLLMNENENDHFSLLSLLLLSLMLFTAKQLIRSLC
jgi:hypothetical protein